jgi:predicted RNA-binding Zn-ribbon protein involved in translation (DUF1610 family)
VSKINEKLGLRAPGKRAMMQLPNNLAARAKLTAAKCPKCGLTGARLSKTQPGAYVCSWCSAIWTPPES